MRHYLPWTNVCFSFRCVLREPPVGTQLITSCNLRRVSKRVAVKTSSENFIEALVNDEPLVAKEKYGFKVDDASRDTE